MKPLRIVTIIVVVLLLLGCFGGKPSVGEILNKTKAKYNDIKTFRGSAELDFKINQSEFNFTVYFAIKKPDKFRVEGDKFLTVSDGKNITVYDKRNKTVVKVFEYKGLRPEVDYGQYIQNLNESVVKLLGEERVNGKDCYVLYVENMGAKTKIFIDKNDYIPLRFVTSLKNRTVSMTYKEFEINPELNDSVFKVS
jgi:outer membrane lipoprotein-sorting protein